MASLYKRKDLKSWTYCVKTSMGRFSLHTQKLSIAKRALAEWQKKEECHKLGIPIEQGPITLFEAYTEYCRHHTKHSPKWKNNIKLHFENRLFPFFGKTTLITSIDARKIQKYQQDRLKKINGRSVDIEVHHVFLPVLRFAAMQGYMDLAQVPKVPKQEDRRDRFRYLSKDEIKLLLDHCGHNDRLGLYVETMLYTGCRPGEAQALRKRDFDLVQGVMHIENREDWKTKTRRSRTVPLADAYIDIVRPWVERCWHPEDLVIGGIGPKTFRRAIVAAGFEVGHGNERAVTPKTLRHTFASWFLMDGHGDLFTLAKILGHSHTRTTEIYGHLSQEHIGRATKNIKF